MRSFEPGKTAKSYFPAAEGLTPIPRLSRFLATDLYHSRFEILNEAARHASPGPWAEFGVRNGKSARVLKAIQNRRERGALLYLFDSWFGLPEDWREGGIKLCRKGKFKDAIMPDIKGTSCVKGFFNDTLSGFVFAAPLGLVHIDSDLESSARTVLKYIPLKAGSVIVFDEYHHATEAGPFGLGECRAWLEAVDARGIKWEYLCKRVRWQTAIRVRSIDD